MGLLGQSSKKKRLFVGKLGLITKVEYKVSHEKNNELRRLFFFDALSENKMSVSKMKLKCQGKEIE